VDRRLRESLDEFEAWLTAERPELHERFKPGLGEDQILALANRLSPYHLPEELVTVYQWHDGWASSRAGEYVPLLYDGTFNSLESAVTQYEQWCELIPEDAWHPLWFPAFGDASGEFIELQPEAGLTAGCLWSYHSHDAAVSMSYDSAASLFRTSLELWRIGWQSSDIPFHDVSGLIAEHNPVTRSGDGRPKNELSCFPSLSWPEAWKVAIGIGPFVPASDSDVVSVAELLADPWCGRPVRGELRGISGSTGWSVERLSDDTGSVQVHLDRATTENFRMCPAGTRFDVFLTPITDGETVDDAMSGCDFGSKLEESVTRRFLEASASSFRATRIVPLA
jgi:cell wall assembly regulator SMI1